MQCAWVLCAEPECATCKFIYYKGSKLTTLNALNDPYRAKLWCCCWTVQTSGLVRKHDNTIKMRLAAGHTDLEMNAGDSYLLKNKIFVPFFLHIPKMCEFFLSCPSALSPKLNHSQNKLKVFSTLILIISHVFNNFVVEDYKETKDEVGFLGQKLNCTCDSC